MDETNRAVMVVFLLCTTAAVLTYGQILDVCTTCHPNATCDNKPDGSGKVCNCKFGFVGNGRTYCQDKDECQIGASEICGPNTTCHNTHGSYFCRCLSGYRPSNNMEVFIPNDGTHCRDINECKITGLCGPGSLCRNLMGSFDCSCQVGYQVHNGPERFNPNINKAYCKEVDCGLPASVENMVLMEVRQTTYRSEAMFECAEGFVWRSGDNSSVCGADGRWIGPTAVCEDVDCGHPFPVPHTHILWNNSSRLGAKVRYECDYGYHHIGKGNVLTCTADGVWEGPFVRCTEILCGFPTIIKSTEQVWDMNVTPGSTVIYFCKEGFLNKGGNNVSVCSENGHWTRPTLSCKEILCGDPPTLPHAGKVWNGASTPGSTVTYFCKTGFYHSQGSNISLCTVQGHWTDPDISCKEVDCGVPPLIPNSIMQWDNISTVGSQVVYQCLSGYHNGGGGNVSVCTADGEWDEASLHCEEINCQRPAFIPHAEVLWDGTSHLGSVVHYRCEDGYYPRGLRNHSKCGENGQWEDIDVWCEDLTCGPPLILPHTNLKWDGTTRPGSVVQYECMDGFYQESGDDISTCLLSGKWGEVSIKCKAKCASVPVLENAEVVWQNGSVMIHRCVDGYHSWRGSNLSVCDSSGVWEEASLKCIKIKPPINHLLVTNEKCLHWKAEKYEEDTEVYTVTYVGSRDYQMSFYDRRKQFVTSKADQLEICLNLLPVTNYSITITAVSARFTTTITISTSMPVPPAPVVSFREFQTPTPTLRLQRSRDTLDPISLFQVFVIPVEGIMVFDCSSPASLSKNKPSTEYITAQIEVRHVGTEISFTVGDGRQYGGFYNTPLEEGRNYYIILRIVSQWKKDLKSTCVVWAKVGGVSHVLRVTALSAVVSIAVIAIIILGGYYLIWFFKKE
ncbi:sushi domain-containing protein 1 isoform X1 [Xyrichtys novacula]|uniref:Sushi domain-containing protein 1 isoform X1 n=1 Tax=Xyrichtys novacula TaxID=13765 RepID=A0AAV1G559_XYRNO|nr:sushi domain-containing protein 1 isoform X1 [Xyrichtys novacula]